MCPICKFAGKHLDSELFMCCFFCLNSSQYNACYGSDKIVTEVIMTLIQIFLSLASRFKNTRNIIKTGVVFPINSVVNSNEM